MTSPYLIRREDFYNKGVHVAALVFGGQRGSYLLSGDLKPGESAFPVPANSPGVSAFIQTQSVQATVPVTIFDDLELGADLRGSDSRSTSWRQLLRPADESGKQFSRCGSELLRK